MLIYRSKHRGCREVDCILSPFIEFIPHLNEKMLDAYSFLLDMDDSIIYRFLNDNVLNNLADKYFSQDYLFFIAEKKNLPSSIFERDFSSYSISVGDQNLLAKSLANIPNICYFSREKINVYVLLWLIGFIFRLNSKFN